MLYNRRLTLAALLLLKRRKTKIISISKRKYNLQSERNGQRKKCFLLSILPMLHQRKLLSTSTISLHKNPKMEIKVLSVTFNTDSTENALVLFMAIVLWGITDLWLYIRFRFSDWPSRSGSNCI